MTELELIVWSLFGVFSILLLSYDVILISKLFIASKERINLMHHTNIITKLKAEYDIIDRPRPYIVKYITIPIAQDFTHDTDYTDSSESEELSENTENTPRRIINGATQTLLNMGIVRVYMFLSKPSELIQKIEENPDVDWEHEVFHLISCEHFEHVS